MSVALVADPLRGALRPRTPYVGLVPYDEGDAAFFFGRSIEAAIVGANLRAARLTILYGPSGVGKSSLLQAGVVHELREEARTAADEAPFAVGVFRSWRDDPVHGVGEAARAALQERAGAEPLPEPAATLAETLRTWTGRAGRLLLVLDQFEEYFQYHPDEGDELRLSGFAAELARIVNDPSLPVHVLLSIREDAWARLDLFEGHVPSLFANYLRVDHLDLAAAREAVEGPIGAWNALSQDERPFAIEPALTAAVLAATAGGGLTLTAGGESSVAEAAGAQAPGNRVEAPFLQLVLDRLWRDTVAAGEHTLTLARLEALGGAARIVENHLLDALGRLTPAEQDVASDCFRFLVSRSKTKIAHPTADLAEWTRRAEPEVTGVLDRLCTGDSGRILRAIAPARAGGSTSYELFHDILAEPVLAWRKQHEQRREREAEAERQRAVRRRLVLGGSVALALAVVFAALAVVAVVERRQADRERQRADGLLQVQQDSNRKLRARIAANEQELASGRESGRLLAAEVEALRETNDSLEKELARLLEAREALDRQIGELRAGNRQLSSELVRLNAANESLAETINELEREYSRLLAAEETLLAKRESLQEDADTLAAEVRALNDQLQVLEREHGRLLANVDRLGLGVGGSSPPPQDNHTTGGSAARPIAAAQFGVPGDVAGSDALRREVEDLQRQLEQQLEKRALLSDEAGWLRTANALLFRQRAALRAEAAQLEETRAALEVRKRELEQTLARADAENRRLRSLAAARELRNAQQRKRTGEQRQANALLQEQNNDRVGDLDGLQRDISSLQASNQGLRNLIAPHLRRLLQGARSLPREPKLAAWLAVDAYRVAPYDADDPAHPDVYDALWLALNRLDPKAAQELVEAPRSAGLKKTLCELAGRPRNPAELSRVRTFLPETAGPALRHPCA